jgi:hypothetical protein
MNDVSTLVAGCIPATLLKQLVIFDGSANQQANLTARRTEAARELINFGVAELLAIVLALYKNMGG